MATLSVIRPLVEGAELADAAAGGAGDVFVNTGDQLVVFRNAAASPRTVTIATPGAPDGLAIDEHDVTVALSSTVIVGPFDPAVFNNASGQVSMTYSTEVNLYVAVIGK